MEPKDSRYGPHRTPIKTDGDGSDTSGDGAPPPAGVVPPTLSMLWLTPETITTEMPKTEGGGGEKTVTKAPTHPALTVNIGGLADSMELLRTSSSDLVTQYENLKTLVLAADASHTVFGEQATYKDNIPKPRPNQYVDRRNPHEPTFFEPDTGPIIKEDPGVRQAAEKFGPVMYPSMKNVLMECANSIELVGRYMVLMDRAGTYYAHADHSSAFPEPTGKPIVDG
ncbi:hypothetical protein [Streptomyces sp. NPDC059080]|uniref:hypothetical protein n=1 Tax=Streptomyces sp. NPDC059080 TaxID=3346718 RepID=UPI00369CE800